MIGHDKFIRTIKLKNLLSYGDSRDYIELESLNVLIGRNSTGKSNLIEAISNVQKCVHAQNMQSVLLLIIYGQKVK